MVPTIWFLLFLQWSLPALVFAFLNPQTGLEFPALNHSSANEVKTYLVYPNEPLKMDLNARVLSQLKQIAGESKASSIERGGFKNRPRQVVIWSVTVDESRVEEIKAMPGVCGLSICFSSKIGNCERIYIVADRGVGEGLL